MAELRRELEFIYTPLFERSARGVLDDESMHHAELELLADPRAGASVAGTGGVRKLRVALPGRGKRGSAAWSICMSRSAAASTFSWRMPRRSSST